jgi:glutamate formiminotransferase / 5-formyltetrahydrofolate cyclo-ligase
MRFAIMSSSYSLFSPVVVAGVHGTTEGRLLYPLYPVHREYTDDDTRVRSKLMTRPEPGLLECVMNLSEGRDKQVISALAAAAGSCLLDVHSDPDHHRSVLTLAGPGEEVQAGARAVATVAVKRIDIRVHAGVHPRIGALDVVPFVDLLCGGWDGRVADGWVGGSRDGRVADGRVERAVEHRDAFALWAAHDLNLPCFLYGPERPLPELRRAAWSTLLPDLGPTTPHPSAGAAAIGARPVLVAYNIWLVEGDLDQARRLARSIRSREVRALGLRAGDAVQVSCNLIAPWQVGPGAVFDFVASQAAVDRAELVGLVPRTVLDAEPRHRWSELGLSPSATIEARLEQAGLNGGRFQGQWM